MTIEYAFDERLALSQGHSQSKSIKDILLENIPGALGAHQAHQENDRNGTDWWVEHKRGYFLSVDCKVREVDWSERGEDDLALETWSVIGQKVGWTRDEGKRTDYILWLWMDTGRWCLVPFIMLCAVYQDKWEEWRNEYKTSRQHTPGENGRGWYSECTFVPRREVWAEIYRRYAGAP